MKKCSLILSTLALAMLALTTTAHAQFTYTFYPDDTTINTAVTTDFAIVGYGGGSYNDDFTRNFTGPASPTVDIMTGASITGEVDVFNTSIVNVAGGDITGFVPFDNSTVNFSGGNTAYCLTFSNAIVNMSNGYVSDMEGQGQAIHVSGGQIDTLIANVHTDEFGNTLGSCLVDVTGGNFGTLQAFNQGILNVSGGSLTGDFLAAFGGTINFYGIGLTTTLLDPNHSLGGSSTYSLYALSGMLTDGTELTNKNLLIRNDNPGVDGSVGQSSFQLIAVPEPGTPALLAMGLLSLAGISLWRRRHTPH